LKRLALLLAAAFMLTSCSQAYTPTDEDRQIEAKASAYAASEDARLAEQARANYDAKTVAVPAVTDRPLRYLLVGDSLANGAAATEPAKSFRELVATALHKQAPVETTLAGKAGQGVQLIAPQAAATTGSFDVIVVEVGTNDAGKTDVAAFRTSYTAMLADLRAKSPAAALVCLGPWRDEKTGLAYSEEIMKACAASNGKYRDLSPLYNTAINRWTTGVMSNGQPAEDNFHPSDTGHYEIAAQIRNALRLDG